MIELDTSLLAGMLVGIVTTGFAGAFFYRLGKNHGKIEAFDMFKRRMEFETKKAIDKIESYRK